MNMPCYDDTMMNLSRSCRRFSGRLRATASALIAAIVILGLPALASAASKIVVLEIDGAIGVATSDYLSSGIEHAESVNADLVILNMDTPGGLVSSMRDMVQAILGSSIPVVTYVTPAGARADSAGTYILLASHVAAMAPTTHLGAATPVSLSGGDATPTEPFGEPASDSTDDDAEEESESKEQQPGSAMEKKVLNDAIAYIRGLAERYDRNADWAEDAVRDAATLTATEALEQNVIEFIADDQADLLQQLNGYEVEVQSETMALNTDAPSIDAFEPNWRIKILAAISNPEIVLILGMIGLYGLMYEGWNPGAIVPGVVGIICLLIAAYALQILPVNYAGLALIIVGLALMTAEAFAPSFGALGLGGIAAFVFGAIMMFDSGIPGFGISIAFVISIAIIAALLIIWMISYILKLRRRGGVSGADSIVGGTGTAMQDFCGDGKVWLEGEAWSARSAVTIEKDREVVVTAIDGLTLIVKPAPVDSSDGAQYQT
jgi:membrane-bound serine protease (ClpP class)